MFKQEKGITLVSLVITIIVMLILAGVSLSMVMGEGSVLNQARTAVDTTELSSVKDEIGLALGSAQTTYYAQYASTTGRKEMNEVLTSLAKSEFTAAACVTIYAPKVVEVKDASGNVIGKQSTGALVYELPNGNVYGCDLTITENSVTQGDIVKIGTISDSASDYHAFSHKADLLPDDKTVDDLKAAKVFSTVGTTTKASS